MATKQEILEKITRLLSEKTGGAKPCVVCGQTAWITPDKFIRIAATNNPNQAAIGGTGFPFQPIICGHCGNTHLINLLLLGIKADDLSSLAYPAEDGTAKT